MDRKAIHDYEELAEQALLLLTNQPLAEAIQGSLNLSELLRCLQNLTRKDDRAWGSASSVGTAIQTERRRRGQDDEDTGPSLWLGAELAFRMEVIYLRLRSSPEAAEPLHQLLDEQRRQPRLWPDQRVAEAARRTFLNALEAKDQLSGVKRADLLPFRAHRNSNLTLLDRIATDPELAAQVQAYWALWGDLLKAYNREILEVLTIPALIEMLGALEEGFLAQAVGMGRARESDFADRFARGVMVMITGSTDAAG